MALLVMLEQNSARGMAQPAVDGAGTAQPPLLVTPSGGGYSAPLLIALKRDRKSPPPPFPPELSRTSSRTFGRHFSRQYRIGCIVHPTQHPPPFRCCWYS